MSEHKDESSRADESPLKGQYEDRPIIADLGEEEEPTPLPPPSDIGEEEEPTPLPDHDG